MIYSQGQDYNIKMRIRSPFFKKQFDLQKAELVGKGTFAQVFRVFDADLNDSLAIRKVKKNQADLQDIAKQKVINEQLRKVDNENILKIYDIIDQQEAVWYITEYCWGGSLWDALNLCQGNKLGEKESLECVLQVSKGVQELHNHRITHRDLKPENILLKTKYIPGKPLPLIKLADFGLSTQKIIMETIAGTKQYIAPEQAKFHNYTNAVDVWSLGIILDEILHGTPFYSGQDNKEVFSKILKTPFKVRNQALRPSLKEFLLTLLKKKPYQRPIIAVIRSTIQKILLQIESSTLESTGRKKSVQSTPSQVSKLNGQSKLKNVDSKVKIGSTPSKQNLIISKKSYQFHQKQIDKQKQKESTPFTKDKILKSQHIKEQQQMLKPFNPVSPLSSQRKDMKKPFQQLFSGQSRVTSDRKQPPKQQIGDTDRSKIQKTPIAKLQSASKSPQTPSIIDKIAVYKNDKRRMVASNIKKQQFKNQIIIFPLFVKRQGNKKNKSSTSKQRYKNNEVFYQIHTQHQTTTFKKVKLENNRQKFIKESTNQDYQIKLLSAQKQIENNAKETAKQLYRIQQEIKHTFLIQIQSFIDQYIDKVLK